MYWSGIVSDDPFSLKCTLYVIGEYIAQTSVAPVNVHMVSAVIVSPEPSLCVFQATLYPVFLLFGRLPNFDPWVNSLVSVSSTPSPLVSTRWWNVVPCLPFTHTAYSAVLAFNDTSSSSEYFLVVTPSAFGVSTVHPPKE